jgi:hypothetical protein
VRAYAKLLCLVTLLLACPPFVAAETAAVVGSDGDPGTAGALGAVGGAGQDGQSVMAVADAPAEANTAEATGGAGGDGGPGGDGVAGGDGGDGGAGGGGGSATAEATTIGHHFVRAIATGGEGGAGGAGGLGSPPGADGSMGDVGRFGSATATASVAQSYPTDGLADGLDGRAIATSGYEGEASASIVGEATGTGSVDTLHIIRATAETDDDPYIPRSTAGATAEATGATTHGALRVEADATLGWSLPASQATAIATGSHSGTGELIVSATANAWGNGGVFFSGNGDVEASGIATGGADVTVSANLFGERDSLLRDAVSGSTSGRLLLVQTLGEFDTPPLLTPAPSLGVARTGLVATNPGGGDLGLLIRARTLLVDEDVPDEGDLVIGDVIGTSTTGANVDVSVFGWGRRIRQESLDDASQQSRIFGSSNGGDVSVLAEFVAEGLEYTTPADAEANGIAGASIHMDNAVDGETSGKLTLVQNGFGERGLSSTVCVVCPNDYPSGKGGDVFNRISRTGAHEFLSVAARSQAGQGGGTSRSGVMGGDGGMSSSILDVTNLEGAVEIEGYSLGGAGGDSYVAPGKGGDAEIEFRAESFGDGHAVLVGYPEEIEFIGNPLDFQFVRHGARGGEGGGSVVSTLFDPLTAPGGSAESHSEGIANGNSEVTVYDQARGGRGGEGGGFGVTSRAGDGSRGGDAISSATAIGGGPSRVVADSKAFGGWGSRRTLTGGEGGDADAFALARGLGEVVASALAEGGSVELLGTTMGSARAVAEVEGATGMATAEARTGAGGGASFTAMVTRATGTSTRVDATATHGASVPQDGEDAVGTAFVTGSPISEDVVLARSRNLALDALMSAEAGASVEAIGQWAARADSGAPSTQVTELGLTLTTPASGGDVALAIFDLDSSNGGFESLSFSLEVLGEAIVEEVVFDDLDEATTYFASLIDLGQAFDDDRSSGAAPHAIRAIFEVVAAGDQQARFGLAAVVVPEPSTAMLIAMGLSLLAARRTVRR